MRIHFYGRLADALGEAVEMDVAAPCTIGELRRRLAAELPSAGEALSGRVRACVGDRIVGDDHEVDTADRVEFLAPVSGG
jgi:molybdopterin converting factor small subunit